MEKEVEELRERVATLEKRYEHVLKLADRIDADVSSINALEEIFIMPAFVLLAGDAYRDRMLRWLDQLVREEAVWVEEESKPENDLLRLRYWRSTLQKREPYAGFAPRGWETPPDPE